MRKPLSKETSRMARSRSAPLAIGLLLLSLAGCDSIDRYTTAEHVQRAQARLDDRKPKEAEIELKRALQQDAKNIPARMLLAQTYLALNRGQDAEIELGHAEQFGADPKSTLLLRVRSYVLQREPGRVLKELPAELTGDPERVVDLTAVRAEAESSLGLDKEADADYDIVLRARPNSTDGLIGKARIAAGKNDLDGALGFLERALSTSPKNTLALLLKGDILLAKKDSDGALAAYRQAVDATADNEAARLAVASALISAGNLDGAREQIEAVKKKYPNYPQANYLDALVKYKGGQYNPANEAVQKTLAATPDYPPAVILDASIQYQLGSLLRAENGARRYLSFFPNSITGRKLLAATLLREKQADKALEVLEPMTRANVNDAQVYWMAGTALTSLNQPARAVTYLTQAASLDPKSSTIQAALGVGNLQAGNLDRAINAFESVVKLDTDSTDSGTLLVLSYITKGSFAKAIEVAQAMVDQHPENAALYNVLGGAYLAKKDMPSARAAFTKALMLKPDLVDAAINLGRLDLAENKPEAARSRLTDVLKASPKNLDAYMALATFEYNAGRLNEATRWLEKAVEAVPDKNTPKIALVRAYLRFKDTSAKALALAKQLQEKDPDNPELLSLLAESQAATGDTDAALATYGRVAGLRPNAPLVQLEIARLESGSGHGSAAAAAAAKALAISPEYGESQMAAAEAAIQAGNYANASRLAASIEKRPGYFAAGRSLAGDVAVAQRNFPVAFKAYSEALDAQKTPILVTKLHGVMQRLGKKKEADDLIKAWMSDHPGDQMTRLYLASSYRIAGDTDRAEPLFQEVLKLDPDNAVALNELALLLSARNDPQAKKLAEHAYTTYPDNPAIGDTFAWILVQSGDAERGRQILEKVLKAAPADPEARYHYGAALLKTGNKALGKSNLEQAIASAMQFAQRDEARKLLAEN